MLKPDKINLYLIILWSALCLASCSQSGTGDDLLTGAFGLDFGAQPEGFGGTFLSELKSIEARDPPFPDSRFETYFYTVTPASHRIYQIGAETGAGLNQTACDTLLEELAHELTIKYFTTGEAIINDADDKWVLQRNSKRSVTLQCLAAPATAGAGKEQAYWLSISFLDYNLASEAYKEWKKKPPDTRDSGRKPGAY